MLAGGGYTHARTYSENNQPRILGLGIINFAWIFRASVYEYNSDASYRCSSSSNSNPLGIEVNLTIPTPENEDLFLFVDQEYTYQASIALANNSSSSSLSLENPLKGFPALVRIVLKETYIGDDTSSGTIQLMASQMQQIEVPMDGTLILVVFSITVSQSNFDAMLSTTTMSRLVDEVVLSTIVNIDFIASNSDPDEGDSVIQQVCIYLLFIVIHDEDFLL